MKKMLARYTFVALLIVLLVPLMPAFAQDGANPLFSQEVSAVYFQSATSGSFADNGDGTYALTLNDVAPSIVWIVSSPSLAIQTFPAVDFAGQWAAATDLMTDAVLEVADLNIALTLGSPVYDEAAATQTYTATVNSIQAIIETKDTPALPETFEAANLSIAWSADFQSGLVEGIQAMYEGLRATPEECASAMSAFTAWYAQDQQYQQAYLAQLALCKTGDMNACTEASNIAAQRDQARQAILPTTYLLSTECKAP